MTWTGDVGRAYVGDQLISDHFWHGRVWDVDLTPWAAEVAVHGVRFELLPWRRSTGVWVDPAVRDLPDGIHVAAIDLVRVGRVRLVAGASREAGSAPVVGPAVARGSSRSTRMVTALPVRTDHEACTCDAARP